MIDKDYLYCAKYPLKVRKPFLAGPHSKCRSNWQIYYVNLKFYVFTESQTGAIIGGVAGGLIGVILLLLLLAAVFYFRAKQGKYILCFLSSPDP